MNKSELNKIKTTNLKIIKKQLLLPEKFRLTEYEGKACFSQAYKKYGFMETWDIALNMLDNLPENENIFNELILSTFKVKPYLDIEWIESTFPNYDIDTVKVDIKNSLLDIFEKEYQYKLDRKDIYLSECHRQKIEGKKYSFHVIISTHPTIVFENTNYASSLAKKLRLYLKDKYDESIVDTNVYHKTQNIRLLGHCKEGESSPLRIVNPVQSNPLEYLITNIDKNHIVLNVPEQKDLLYKNIKNIKKIDFATSTEDINTIIEKVKLVHPSATLERHDASGFLQFNYTDRKEKCFTDDNKEIYHDRIGFFAYIYDNLICVGCHSGNCVNSSDNKILKILGSIDSKKNLTFEKVDCNNKFEICHVFVRDCIINGALGMSNLFERMYLKPKRIKWINDTKWGSSYFWDGKLWQEDDYSFIERLLVTTIVSVLRDFQIIYKKNSEIENDEQILDISHKMITKLNDGLLINNIIKFVKPLIRDTYFSKIKDINPYKLSCKNGMVDLISGELRAAVPEDNITRSLDTEYDKNAYVDDFDQFVRQITSNEKGEDIELYNFFRWCIGYAMQGSPKKKIFIILYGPHGFNGKSLVMNTIKDVLEMYAVAMDSSVVLDNGTKKSAGAHSTELCQLENCRLGLLSDTKVDACIDDGQMKQLTGITDKLSVREIFGKQKEFTPTFVPFISTNHPIQVNLTDQAMYERLILFPFVLSFVDNPVEKYHRKADNSLAEKFKHNKSGILKWLVDCSVYYNKNQDKDIPQSIKEAKEKYNKQVNTYVDFIDTIFDTTNDDSNTVKRIDLLESYKSYMQQNCLGSKCKPILAGREFDKILKIKPGNGSKCYIGIKYKEEEEEVEDDLM